MFADGGVMALGANLFNLAMVGPLVGYAVYRGLRSLSASPRNRIAAAAFAGWCGLIAAAVSCAGQLAWSGIVRWSAVFPAMVSVHLLIGLGEGLITGLILGALARYRPEIFGDNPAAEDRVSARLASPPGDPPSLDLSRPVGSAGWSIAGYTLLLLTGLALFIAPFASPWPDGLERVADRLGFSDPATQGIAPRAPFPDYTVGGLGSAVWATLAAGGVGAVLTYGLSWLLAVWLTRRAAGPAQERPPGRDQALAP
jgi:cobalt/nickel transport system permease protein